MFITAARLLYAYVQYAAVRGKSKPDPALMVPPLTGKAAGADRPEPYSEALFFS